MMMVLQGQTHGVYFKKKMSFEEEYNKLYVQMITEINEFPLKITTEQASIINSILYDFDSRVRTKLRKDKQKVKEAIKKCKRNMMNDMGSDTEVIFPDELLKELGLEELEKEGDE